MGDHNHSTPNAEGKHHASPPTRPPPMRPAGAHLLVAMTPQRPKSNSLAATLCSSISPIASHTRLAMQKRLEENATVSERDKHTELDSHSTDNTGKCMDLPPCTQDLITKTCDEWNARKNAAVKNDATPSNNSRLALAAIRSGELLLLLPVNSVTPCPFSCCPKKFNELDPYKLNKLICKHAKSNHHRRILTTVFVCNICARVILTDANTHACLLLPLPAPTGNPPTSNAQTAPVPGAPPSDPLDSPSTSGFYGTTLAANARKQKGTSNEICDATSVDSIIDAALPTSPQAPLIPLLAGQNQPTHSSKRGRRA